jgi:hypothetical protein
MSMGESHASSALMMARRMLWYREVGRDARPQPVIILLGPVGSGKTSVLEAISADFGWGVVHASFDFKREDPPTTIEILTQLAYNLSREWPHRAKPRFTRFAIALIALQTPLSRVDRARDREKLRNLLKEFRRELNADDLVNLVRLLASAVEAANLLSAPFVDRFTELFVLLIRFAGRRRLGAALRSIADFPQAEGAGTLDALVELNRLAHEQPADAGAVNAWLIEEFLADVRANHRKMSAPDAGSPCDCTNPGRLRHLHTWVLLLDNVDQPGGTDFLATLTTARDDYRRRRPDDPDANDALLTIATSGRWHRQWESGWQAPWKPDPSNRSRPVPSCGGATYEQWADASAWFRPSPYYPVFLDPLDIRGVARILETSPADPKAALAHRATGGLLGAVCQLKAVLAERIVEPGSRAALSVGEPAGPASEGARSEGAQPEGARSTEDLTGNPWYSRLTALRLADHLGDVHIDDFVTAAPFATAPWLIPTSATSRIRERHVGRILTELRTAFWVTAPPERGVIPDYVTLHPWVAGNLVSALAHHGPREGASRVSAAGSTATSPAVSTAVSTDTGTGNRDVRQPSAADPPGDAAGQGGQMCPPSYERQFIALRDDPETGSDPIRIAYCQLALGDISPVVALFADQVDQRPHQDWVDRVILVVHAPDNFPLDRDFRQLYEELVNDDIAARPLGRTEIRNNVARLIAASHLAANPFAVHGQDQNNEIANAFEALARVSQRPDVDALYHAADQARRGKLP